jgi:2-iminobutanoate/2-iminopropanoate deaminase
MPKREIINPEKGAIYSPAIRFGNLVFTRGIIGADSSGKPADGIRSQARICMDQLKALLEDAGTSIDNAVKVLAFVIDLKDRAVFNEVYREYFHTEPPARSCVAVSDMGEGVLLEVECIACIPD